VSLNLEMALTYLDFVTERHRIWEARQRGEAQPWTKDPILASRKFTNVFRVLDPGSQFVFKLESDDPTETLMRLFLYRHTNLPSAWEHVAGELGEWPSLDNLAEVELVWKLHRDNGNRVFSSAYMVYPQSSVKGTDKVESIIDLTRRLFVSGKRVAYDFLNATSQADRFAALRTNKGVADFMSMQILTDFGYTRHGADVEDQFVVAGPGSKRGAALVWPELTPREVIRWAQEAVHGLPDCPVIEPHDGVLRKPSAMDIQNTFCEFSKYVRYLHRPSREQPYRPAHPNVALAPVLPGHWNR
jgi:hypothetical protein